MSALLATIVRSTFRRRLLRWFDASRRDLPWRRTRDAYAIWVAEIMLQQTRVAAVLEHYREFLRRFPTVETLARARSSAVLAAWSGLGYYRRARALHQAAKVILHDYSGRLPQTEQELAQLPGVGRYTAAAIASTAFGHPCAVVDGNVARVLTRLLGGQRQSRQKLWSVAEELLSRRRPGDFNQAMMELGATVCLPASPRCDRCLLRSWCASCQSAAETQSRREKQSRHKQQVAYLLAQGPRGVFLVRRDIDSALMPGMWELPPARVARARRPPKDGLVLRHSITRTDFQVTVIPGAPPAGQSGRWIGLSRLRQLPLTGLARKVLRRAGII